MTNRDLGLGLGGQKSSQMMTFSKHENHEQSMYIAPNLILEEGQKQIKIESQKNKKRRKNEEAKKHQTSRVQGVMTLIG